MRMWTTTLLSTSLAAMVRQIAWRSGASIAVMFLCNCSLEPSLPWACKSHGTPQGLLPMSFAARATPSSTDSAALASFHKRCSVPPRCHGRWRAADDTHH